VSKEDIDAFADAMAYHLPKAIEEENDQIERVYSDFNIPYRGESKALAQETADDFIVEEYSSIKDIDAELWDAAMECKGNYSHSGLACIEEIFRDNNGEPQNNWSFHYLLIKDKAGRLVCATFFTCGIYKDDMLAPEHVSRKIEEIRKNDPYYLCSRTLAMGCLFSEGEHIYLNDEHPQWKESIRHLFRFVEKKKKEVEAEVVIFRDFDKDHILNEFLEDEGYAKIRMPNATVIQNPKWETYEELLSFIDSSKKRRNIRYEAIKNEALFDVRIKDQITEEEGKLYVKLFTNIKNNNFAFNFFPFPEKMSMVTSKYDDWEYIEICLKGEKEAIGVVWSFRGKNHYCPFVMGLNYDYQESHFLYKQVIFQIIKRANDLGKKTVYMGFSADYEKEKYNGTVLPKYAFMKVNDTFNLELMETFSNTD
jgi:hypothetical protein